MRRIDRLKHLAIGLLIAGFGATGCFVIDEIDKGQEEMRKHSPAGAKTAGKESQASEEGMDFASLTQQGADRFGNLQERVEEAMKPERDPDDVVVRCEVDGRTQFMRKFSCQSLGGRVH